MSLKTFHLLFIAGSILLLLGFAGWAVVSYRTEGRLLDLAGGMGGLVGGVALILYGRYVLRKLKNIGYL